MDREISGFFPIGSSPKKPMRRNGGADVVLGDPDLKRSGLTVDDSQIVMFFQCTIQEKQTVVSYC